MEATNVITQTILLHQSIFNPSITPKGRRLKKAIRALIHAPQATIMIRLISISKVSIMHTAEKSMLVMGPERAVFPAFSLETGPAIIIAPGEIILKKGSNIEMRVTSAPCMVNRNSAHKPKYCADILWASSWRRKLSVNIIARPTRLASSKKEPYRVKDKPTPITSNAPTVKCLSSVVLNLNVPVAVREG